MQTHAEPVAPRRSTTEQRLFDLMQEAMIDCNGDHREAIEQFRRECEQDVELIIAVVGGRWANDAAMKFRQLWLSAHGRQMGKGVGMAPPAVVDLEQKRRRATRVELGLLASFTIDGKPLGVCTKKEIVFDQQRSARRSRFLGAVADILPSDDAVVQDHLTPAQAASLMEGAAA